jgi:hypothetical protein
VTDSTPLWLVILGALGIVAALVVRRMSQLAGRTRELERFQQAVTQLDLEFEAATRPVVAALDEIRRHAGDPGALADALPATSDAIHRCMADTRALRPPAILAEHAAALVLELERAVRALQLVEHGLDALRTGRGPRELEAQVSLKRGALYLRHARDAFGDVVKIVVAVDPASLAKPAGGQPAAPPPGVPTYLVEGVDPEPDVAFDPRM